MKKHVDKLHEIANREVRHIIGLMSGTSLDGLDIALCRVTGAGTNTNLTVEKFETTPYTENFKGEIRKIFAKREIDFQHLCILNAYIGREHATMVLDCLEKWEIAPDQVDLIASHGQTVFHAPSKQHGISGFPNATLQIGDGDHIAIETGIITVSDFRQKHIAAGGEGAPLAVYGDYFLFSKKEENRILLNMGGIANFTYLPDTLEAAEVFTTDTGPGNTLIDAFTQKHFEKAYDEGGTLAAKGKVDEVLLNALKSHSFFSQSLPKTTGPEVFNLDYVEKNISKLPGTLSDEDILATLTRFSADTISDCIQNAMQEGIYEVYASGGGAHNPLLMHFIQENLGQSVRRMDELGVSGDSKEAVLFAVLANEAVAGTDSHFGKKEGVPDVSMGKVSFPG